MLCMIVSVIVLFFNHNHYLIVLSSEPIVKKYHCVSAMHAFYSHDDCYIMMSAIIILLIKFIGR